MTLPERLDALLAAVRAGEVPAAIFVGVRDERELAAAQAWLRGRKGAGALEVGISDDPRDTSHSKESV